MRGGWCLLALWPGIVWAQEGQTVSVQTQLTRTATTVTEATISVSQLYTDDDLSDRHTSFGEARATLVGGGLFGVPELELAVDARGHARWQGGPESFVDVSRAFVQYGGFNSSFSAQVGRIPVPGLLGARVDGAHLSVRLGEGARLGAFGGFTPHPITGALDPSFVLAGTGFEVRSPTANHQGGAALQLFGGQLDRLWLSEQSYFFLSSEWMAFGSFVVDLVAPRGLLGDLGDKAVEDQSAVDKIDLTQGQVLVRWRPAPVVDLSVGIQHFHTVLPNRWWQDWLESQRAARGFIVDGPQPLGTRRSTAKVIANLHLSPALTPYLVVRYDRRHGAEPGEVGDDGYEAQLGLKLLGFDTGYADVSLSQRRLFGTEGQVGSLSAGIMFFQALTLDAWSTVMRLRPLSVEERQLMADVGGAVGFDFVALSQSLSGVRLMGQYQAFIDPDVSLSVFYVQVGYRYKG